MRKDVNKTGGPDAGFTQRATMDLELEEIYMFSGLVREKGSVQEVVKNRCVQRLPVLRVSPSAMQ